MDGGKQWWVKHCCVRVEGRRSSRSSSAGVRRRKSSHAASPPLRTFLSRREQLRAAPSSPSPVEEGEQDASEAPPRVSDDEDGGSRRRFTAVSGNDADEVDRTPLFFRESRPTAFPFFPDLRSWLLAAVSSGKLGSTAANFTYTLRADLTCHHPLYHRDAPDEKAAIEEVRPTLDREKEVSPSWPIEHLRRTTRADRRMGHRPLLYEVVELDLLIGLPYGLSFSAVDHHLHRSEEAEDVAVRSGTTLPIFLSASCLCSRNKSSEAKQECAVEAWHNADAFPPAARKALGQETGGVPLIFD
uniref:Uncharacterized protein n=1 Tax=Oryza sativa subsp. japonica TaxID=39947 RepID=Q68UR0_ORYSJ|nr:hypothetical protein [Oryza sativa Japonica Group]